MGILAWLVLGALAGWIASIIMKTDAQQGALANIVVGIVGAMIGGFVFNLLGGKDVSGFNIYSLVVAVVGSVILLAILKAIKK
ncbi:MAG: GlsB/YeaQ/YmgE family stress response membrane protein [Candidatus Saccharimonadales bacterium]